MSAKLEGQPRSIFKNGLLDFRRKCESHVPRVAAEVEVHITYPIRLRSQILLQNELYVPINCQHAYPKEG
jgi:hypothetical protein